MKDVSPLFCLCLCLSPALTACPSGDDEDSHIPAPTPPEEAGCGVPYPGGKITVESDGRFQYLLDFPSDLLTPTRTIRVFLPEGYDTATDTHYPVLYMHDGQNLFDADTAAYGMEWEVDENVDALVGAGSLEPLIVVGIDNTADRMSEYTPTADPVYGGGNGDNYAHFIMDELKPYIDTHYRTQCETAATGVMGSSLGGLISHYIGWYYPDVFGFAGCVSPSYWWDSEVTLAMVEDREGEVSDARFWIDMGTGEGGDSDADGLCDAVREARDVRDAMRAKDFVFGQDLYYQEVYAAVHNETAWAARVANPLLAFLGTQQTPSLTGISVLLYGSTVGVEGCNTLQLEVNSAYENSLEMTLPNDLVALSSGDPTLATVSSEGIITGVSTGTTVIRGEYEGMSNEAPLEVVEDLPCGVQVTLRVTVPDNTPEEDIVYVSGDLEGAFGGYWVPNGRALEPVGTDLWSTTFSVERGTTFSYKFTRGGWGTVEKNADGSEMSNRVTTADETKTVEATVVRWADSGSL